MADMEKVMDTLDATRETLVRHDERIKAAEQGNQKAMELISKLDGEINEKFDMLLREMREGFSKTHERIDDIEGAKRDSDGYQRGIKETRTTMLKQFGLWVSIAGLGASFLFWWFTR